MESIKIYNNKAADHIKKGDQYFRKKKYYDAYDQYNLGLRADPFSIILQIKLGLTQQKMGYPQLAIERFRCALPAQAYQFLRDYVAQNYNNINKNIKVLQWQLKSIYNIPLTQKLLKQFISVIKKDLKYVSEDSAMIRPELSSSSIIYEIQSNIRKIFSRMDNFENRLKILDSARRQGVKPT